MADQAAAHTALVKRILVTFGALPDVLLAGNPQGRAKFYDKVGLVTSVVPFGWPVSEGSPDILGIVAPHARLFGLEAKTGSGHLSPAQVTAHAVLRRFGARVFVVHSLDEARAAIAQMRAS